MSIIKSYFMVSFVFALVTYILPNESYKKYVKYFIGIIMSVIILQGINDMLKISVPDASSSYKIEYDKEIKEEDWFEEFIRQKVKEN